MNLSQEHQQRYKPQPQITQRQFEAAPILYSLEGIHPFLHEIRSTLEDPGAKTSLFITGESGSGKELIAGQLIHEIQETNPDVELGYLSFGMAMKAARDPIMARQCNIDPVTRTGLEYDAEDYRKASRMMTYLIEAFYTRESERPKLVVVETVGYTYPTLDQGSSTISQQAQNAKGIPERNVFLLELLAAENVQEATFKTRDAAGRAASPEELNELFRKQRIRRDSSFMTSEDVARFSSSRGSRFHLDRQIRTTNANLQNNKNPIFRGNLRDPIARAVGNNNGEITNDLLANPPMRRSALEAYAAYLATEVWHVEPPSHILIAHNDFFPMKKPIPYYNSLTAKYALIQ